MPQQKKHQDPTLLLLFDSRRGNQEGKEHERVLACYPYDLDINDQTVITGMAQAQTSFLKQEAESSSPVTVLTMRDRTWVIEQLEPSIYLLLVVNRSLWGHRDGPKDNVLREFTSLAGILLQGTLGSLQSLLNLDPTGTEVRLQASPIMGATVQAFEDVEGPMGRAFLSTPLAECAYPRVLPWGDRTKNLCQLLRQEIITWSGSRLRRRQLDDGTTRLHGGDLSAQVVILYSPEHDTSKGRRRWSSLRSTRSNPNHASTFLVESSVGPRDTQLLYWIGTQALSNEAEIAKRAGGNGSTIPEDRPPVASAADVTRSVFHDDYTPPLSARSSARGVGAPTFPAPPSVPASSSWLMTALNNALPSWMGKKAEDRRMSGDDPFSGSGRGSGLTAGFLLRSTGARSRQASASESPLSISSLWDWGSASSPRHRAGSTGANTNNTNYSPNSPYEATIAVAASRIGTFLTTAPDLTMPGNLMVGALYGEGSYRNSSGYAYEGSYRNARASTGLALGPDITSPSTPTAGGRSSALPIPYTRKSEASGMMLAAEGSYRGGDFTWANCYASVAINAHLKRHIRDESDTFDHPIIAAEIRANAVRVFEGQPVSSASPVPSERRTSPAPSAATSATRRKVTTPLEARHWKPVVCDVEVPASTSNNGSSAATAASAAQKMLQLVTYFPEHETFRGQFGGRLCTVHLQGTSGHCALVPVRTGPLLFLVVIPIKRLDQSVEAMLNNGRESGAGSAVARGLEFVPTASEGQTLLPVPSSNVDVSPSNPRYRRYAQERALEVVAGICGDVLLKVADQLGPAATKDSVEMQEGDLRGIRYLARNCELRQSMATPERKALHMSVEASEALERLRACLYEGNSLPANLLDVHADSAALAATVPTAIPSPSAARTVGIVMTSPDEQEALLRASTGTALNPVVPFLGRGGGGKAIEPGSWSALSLTFSRSLGVVLPGKDAEVTPGSRPTSTHGTVVSEVMTEGAGSGSAPLTRAASIRSNISVRSGSDLPRGMRELIVKAADGTWICVLEKFADPSRPGPESPGFDSSGDSLNKGRKIQLFVVASRRETKEQAREKLLTLASKLDL